MRIARHFFCNFASTKNQPDGLPHAPHLCVGRRKVRAAQGIPLLNGKLSARVNQCRRKQPPEAAAISACSMRVMTFAAGRFSGKGEKVGQEPTSRMVTCGLCTSEAESSCIPAHKGCPPGAARFPSGYCLQRWRVER